MSAVQRTQTLGLARPMQGFGLQIPFAMFSNQNSNNNSENDQDAHQKVLEKERKLKEALSESQRNYYQAHRLAIIRTKEAEIAKSNNWWNRFANEFNTEDKIEDLPHQYINKYATLVRKQEQAQVEVSMEISKSDKYGFYDQIKDLKALRTNEEIKQIEDERNLRLNDPKGLAAFEYTKDNYMKRQPRLDLSKYNYNFEQFKQYTQLYEEAKKKDQEELKYFYKMVRYTKLNAGKDDRAAVNFAKKYRLDLIEIPEEFKNVSIDDFEIRRDRRSRRQIIRNRTSRDMTKYDAWRCFDRELVRSGPKMQCTRKIQVIPAQLVKAFGLPTQSRVGFDTTGEFDFEDNNLDVFNISDHRQTIIYHGLNREDEFYKKYEKLPPHRRKKKWPTVEEFWTSNELQTLRLYAQDQADFRKFRIWLRKKIEEAVAKPKSFDEECAERFKGEVDICLGTNYDEVGKVNHTEIGVLKWDFTYFMTPDELKKFPKDKLPEKHVVPKSFDFSQAERVFITKEELKRREMEEEKMRGI